MNYDGLFILDLGGKDEGLPEAIENIEKAITGLDGNIEAVQKMDKCRFERVAGKLDSGFYVNVRFDLDSAKLAKLRTKFDKDSTIYRQFYLRADQMVAAKEEAAAAA